MCRGGRCGKQRIAGKPLIKDKARRKHSHRGLVGSINTKVLASQSGPARIRTGVH